MMRKKHVVWSLCVWVAVTAGAGGQGFPSGPERGGEEAGSHRERILEDARRIFGDPRGEDETEGPAGGDAEEQALREEMIRVAVGEVLDERMSKLDKTGERVSGRRNVRMVNRSGPVAYGNGQVVLDCNPMVACVILLEEGEEFVGSVRGGGNEEWSYKEGYFGPPGNRVPFVTWRPNFWGISTNLVVFTDRRINRFGLRSSPDPGKGSAELFYDELVFFTYPEGPVVEVPEVVVPAASTTTSAEGADGSGAASGVRFPFRWIEPGRKKRSLGEGSKEVQIWTTGGETFVFMPETMREELGEWPLVRTFLGSELVAGNADFESGEGGGIWRIPMIPSAVELYRGKRFLRAEAK